jgi:hypothetical protein
MAVAWSELGLPLWGQLPISYYSPGEQAQLPGEQAQPGPPAPALPQSYLALLLVFQVWIRI